MRGWMDEQMAQKDWDSGPIDRHSRASFAPMRADDEDDAMASMTPDDGAVTRCAERATPSTTGEGSSVKSARGGDHATLTSDNLVVVENPPTVSESGKIVSNITVGVRLGSNGGESRRGE